MPWTTSVLVVANVTATSDELLEALSTRAADGPTRFHLLVPAPGGERAGARVTLDAALAKLHEAGLSAGGSLGDADPIAAVYDAWDPREYDEIVVSTLPTDASRWLALDLPPSDRAHDRRAGDPHRLARPRAGGGHAAGAARAPERALAAVCHDVGPAGPARALPLGDPGLDRDHPHDLGARDRGRVGAGQRLEELARDGLGRVAAGRRHGERLGARARGAVPAVAQRPAHLDGEGGDAGCGHGRSISGPARRAPARGSEPA